MTKRNDTIIKVIRGEQIDHTPVWIMRQAGRYLPEFRQVRSKYDFFTICRTPELATEVTLQPITRFNGLFDASIIFSDILVIPQCFGMIVEMKESVGPHFPFPLRDPAEFFNSQSTDQHINPAATIEGLQYVYDAIKMTSKQLDVPLHGFCGAPWTLLAYMVEGGGSKQFAHVKKFIRCNRSETLRIMDIITSLCIDHLVAQAEAGCELLQVFDSWAGELSPADFQDYSLPYLRRIASEVKKRCGAYVTVFAKGAHYAVEMLLESDYDVIGLDWTMDVTLTKRRVSAWLDSNPERRSRVVLQGNMDPTILYAPVDIIEQETKKMLQEFIGGDNRIGYICNLGHGIQPTVPVPNVQCFLETVRMVSSRMLADVSGVSKQ